MRPATMNPDQVGGGAMGGVFASEAYDAWDEYEMRGNRGVLFAWLWSTMVMQQKLIFTLFKMVAEMKESK